MYETYSEEVMENFMHPRNMGEIKEKDLKKGESLAVGKVGNPVCGDVMQIFVKIKDNKILDIKIKTFGCVAAIACSSVTTDLAIGMTVEKAKKITKTQAAKELGGLPPIKMHCSNLAAEALHTALENYEKGKIVKK